METKSNIFQFDPSLIDDEPIEGKLFIDSESGLHYESRDFNQEMDLIFDHYTSHIFSSKKRIASAFAALPRGSVIIEQWKNTQNLSARIIEVNEQNVLLECLIDKRIRQYQERRFNIDLFDGIAEIKQGKLIMLQVYQKPQHFMIKIVDGEGMIPKSDFQNNDVFEKVRKSSIFKEIS